MSRDALIVGVNQYQNLPSLTAAAKDAEGVANVLETHGDFRVRRLPEVIENQRPHVGRQTLVSAQQLEASLVRLLLPKGDHIPEAVFFYFSGHGFQREIGIREGYLATSDTQPGSANGGLSLSWLRRLIRHSPVRQIIIILDCCHSGEFLSLKDEAWQGCDGQSYLFIAASREYEEAYESLESEYSVLTQALLSGLLPQQSANRRVTSTDLVASVTNQLSNEIQQPLFEQGGSEIIITRQSETPLSQKENISLISRLKQYSFNFCPYRGSQPFEEKHTDYYFGRDALIQELLQTLQQNNICVLMGPSGSGKTSLLRAGISPHLSAGNGTSEDETCIVRYVTPGVQPLKSLATAFIKTEQGIEVASQLLQAENLLKSDPNGLTSLVTAALLRQPTAQKFWLIVDQFEDLLESTANPQTQQEQQQAISALLTALRCPSKTLGVIIGLRSDTAERLLSHGELAGLIKSNRVTIPPMTYQEIRETIEKPAEKLGLKIDPYLVHNLTLDLTGAPGELALLQDTLQELWQHRTYMSYGQGRPCLSLESYMKLGRLSKMLTNRATVLYQSLQAEEQAAARRIFLALCALDKGRLDQCRRTHLSELVNKQFPKELIERTLQKLLSARLVVSDNSITAYSPPADPQNTIELAHKSLVSDWPLMHQWLQTNLSALRQQRDIEERAWVWHQRGELNCTDYLMGQQYIKDFSQFLRAHSQDLSTMAQRFVELSRRQATYQRWQTRGIAVLFPLAMMTGMTVSLVHHQLAINWRADVTLTRTALLSSQNSLSSEESISPMLPQRWGMVGAGYLTATSQVLNVTQQHPQPELNQTSNIQLARAVPDPDVAPPQPLPDDRSGAVNVETVDKP
ncbi:MAG: caspase family protein [Cyanobacteria bacterium P01_A01_bin.15]